MFKLKNVPIDGLVWFMVFNATINNISAISWRPVLVVEEAGVPGENHRRQGLIIVNCGYRFILTL